MEVGDKGDKGDVGLVICGDIERGSVIDAGFEEANNLDKV